RRLRSLGLAVTYVRNITDVDDKILMRAKENGEPPLELSRRMTAVYQEQMRALGCLDPDVEPRVSEHLEPVYTLIRELLEANAAYFVEIGRASCRERGEIAVLGVALSSSSMG